jgi:hypothetical protein
VENVTVEEALDARTAMMELSNVILVVVHTKWNVLTVMVLEQTKMIANALDAQELEHILVKIVVVRI